MKKHFFLMALAAVSLTCFTACGDDDEKKDDDSIKLTEVKYADKACDFDFAEDTKAVIAVKGVEENIDDAPRISNINVSESGQGLVELTYPNNEKKYLVSDVRITDKAYEFSGEDIRGTVVCEQISRASNDVQLTINLTINLPGLGAVTYSTEGEAVEVVQNVVDNAGALLSYLARTWKVLQVEVKLDGDVKAFTVTEGGDLRQLRKVAIENGATFSAKDSLSMEKSIVSVTFSKNGLLTLVYDNGDIDVADTKNSLNEATKSFTLKLKDQGMGSLFIADDSRVDVDLFSNRCNLKLYTTVYEKDGAGRVTKTYNVTLIVRTQEA